MMYLKDDICIHMSLCIHVCMCLCVRCMYMDLCRHTHTHTHNHLTVVHRNNSMPRIKLKFPNMTPTSFPVYCGHHHCHPLLPCPPFMFATPFPATSTISSFLTPMHLHTFLFWSALPLPFPSPPWEALLTELFTSYFLRT